jgi:hypothetical protein
VCWLQNIHRGCFFALTGGTFCEHLDGVATLKASEAGGSFAFTTGPMTPLFPFGWGLSYASFKVGAPTATGFVYWGLADVNSSWSDER